MLQNLINWQDFLDLCNPLIVKRLLRKLTRKSIDRTIEAWSHTENRKVAWGQIPGVQERINHLISGDRQLDYRNYFASKFFDGKKGLSAVSLACGTGENEVRWFETGIFEKIEGYDLSMNRINAAVENAEKYGYENNLEFHVADMYEILDQEKTYDVVLCHMSLHHFAPMEKVVEKIHQKLNEQGLLIIYEYTGPDRLQWDRKHLKICNSILQLLPNDYRWCDTGARLKNKVYAPSVLRMMIDDASEAVESSKIMECVSKFFVEQESKNMRGAILHPLFSRIAHNFTKNDPDTEKLIQCVFDIEDVLYSLGELPKIYTAGVYAKR